MNKIMNKTKQSKTKQKQNKIENQYIYLFITF